MRFLAAALAFTLGLSTQSGCFAPVLAGCPGCRELLLEKRPAVPKGTQAVFVLVPGLLGYGWEWNDAQSALARYPGGTVLVYSWEPWHSLAASSARLSGHLEYLMQRLPGSVKELVVIAHSAAGLLAVDAASRLGAKAGRRHPAIRVLSVGAPLAGMGRNPWGGEDLRHTPLPIALGSRFTVWPEPAPGVTLEIYPTSAEDPVMKPSLGHDPADPRVLPRRALLRKLPPSIGHNYALGWLCQRLATPALSAEPPR